MSRRGICHIWFMGRHISPLMPYREARSVAESSEGPTASKSDRKGPKSRDDSFGATLQRRCLEVLRFSLLLKHSVCAYANVLALRYLAYQKKLTCWVFFSFVPAIDISVDFIGINVT